MKISGRWLDVLVPMELKSAISSARSMREVARSAERGLLRASIRTGAPYGIGAALALPFASAVARAEFSSTLVTGVLAGVVALGAILIGFLINLLLFTGRVHVGPNHSFEVVDVYAQRVKLLLVSQTATLYSSALMVLLALVWSVEIAMKSAELVQGITGVLLGGAIVLTIGRAALLPLQIFELHQAYLEDLLVDARRRTNELANARASRGKPRFYSSR